MYAIHYGEQLLNYRRLRLKDLELFANGPQNNCQFKYYEEI